MKNLTKAQFVRDLKSGHICAMELKTWYGKTGDDIPERLRGVRLVAWSGSTILGLKNNASGAVSELSYGPSALMAYTGDTVTFYTPGLREPTSQEKEVLQKAAAIESYWSRKAYFLSSPCPWMDGTNFTKGKKFDARTGQVMDRNVKGTAILTYDCYYAVPATALLH